MNPILTAMARQQAKPLPGDRRAIAPYEGPKQVLPLLAKPLTKAQCEKYFVYNAGAITFTAEVPQECVEQGPQALNEYLVETAFAFPVRLTSCEFREVVALSATDEDFVVLQVTCSVSLP